MTTFPPIHPSRRRSTIAVALSVLTCLGLASAEPKAGESAKIDADATAILKAMSAKLSAAKQFTLKGTRTIDTALTEGSEVKLTAKLESSVARPNKIVASASDSLSTRHFYYDGKNVTLHDSKANHYATVQGADNIDKTIDMIVKDWDFHPPLADLLVSDPYTSLSKNATGGKLVGTEEVSGVKCHHLVVTQEAIDWEVWISAEDSLPRRFVITFNGIEGKPKLSAEITNWDLDPKLPASKFTFTAPKDAQKIEMVPAGS